MWRPGRRPGGRPGRKQALRDSNVAAGLLAPLLAWKPVRRIPKLRKPLWRFFRPKHLLPLYVAAPVTGAARYGALPYVSRRLRIFGRPRHVLPLYLAAPVKAVFYKHQRLLRFRRPLWRFFRPRHGFVQVAAAPPPSAVVYKRQRLFTRYRRPLWRFFRPKHVLPLYVAAPVTGAGYGLTYSVRRRSNSYFFKPQAPLHRFAVIQHCLRNPIVGILLPDPWQRKLRIFFRPKHLTQIFPPPLPPSSLSWKRPALRNRARRPLWKFYRPRHLLGYVPPQPSTQKNVEWLVRYRRRGRR